MLNLTLLIIFSSGCLCLLVYIILLSNFSSSCWSPVCLLISPFIPLLTSSQATAITFQYLRKVGSRITWLKVRVRIHIPGPDHWPDRIRVVVKERGALLLPYYKKLVSIPLYKNCWRQVGKKRWYNEQTATTPVRLGDLLQRAEKQQLALQVYCLRGSTVQHKALGLLKRLLQKLHDDELILELHYPGCSSYHHHSISLDYVATKPRLPAQMTRSGVERTAEVITGEPNNLVQQKTPLFPSSSPQLPATPTLQEMQANPGDVNPSVPTDQKVQASPEVVNSLTLTVKERTSTNEVTQSTPTFQEVQTNPRKVTPPLKDPSPHPPCPVRFPDSGSVFAELLREYELATSQEHAAAKMAADERSAVEEAANFRDVMRLTRHCLSWRRHLQAVSGERSILWAPALFARYILSQDIKGRLLTVLVVLAGVGLYCWFCSGGDGAL